MPTGRLKIRRKDDGTISRFIQIPGGQKLGIPRIFVIPEEFHNRDCEYETAGKEGIVKILVNGKEIPKDENLAQARVVKRQEEEAQRKEQEAAAKRAKQQEGANKGFAPVQAEQEAFSIDNTKLPKDTRKALGSFSDQIDNFALRVQKCANFWSDNKSKATLYQRTKGSRKLGTPNQIMRHTLSRTPHANYGHIDFERLRARAEESTQLLYEDCRVLQLPLDGRLVMGIGGASVFETGFTLHHVYGFPYIPSSSLKGVIRSWIITEAFEGNEGAALADKSFCDLFGCPAEWKKDKDTKFKSWYETNKKPDKESGDRIGNIVFCDALPVTAPIVKEDIMNVHYPDYYKGKMPPTDFQSPNPIPFLTVENTTFQFLIGFKPLPGMEDATASGPIAKQLGANDGELSLLEAGKQWLLKALTEHGIGAKTAVGYGFFRAS